MGIDLDLYRLRIGRFGPGRGYRATNTHQGSYDIPRSSDTPDICYRLLATYLVIGLVLIGCRESMVFRDVTLSDIVRFASGIPSDVCVGYTGYDGNTMSDINLYVEEYAGFRERMLVLSADVETNPGPLSESEQTLLNAIQASETRVLAEINDVKTNIDVMKNDFSEVKSECLKIKSDIDVVKSAQAKTDKQVKSLKTSMNNIQGVTETLQLDIDQMHENFETKVDLLADIEDELDRLDRENRKATMRIFGLPETINERSVDAKNIVTENVLKVACNDEEWSPDDLQSAFRVGESNDDQPRIMMATFRYADDKFKVYAERARLREKGIRVSDDLTKRQRKKLKEKGYNGYFYKGQVHVRQKTVITKTNAGPSNMASFVSTDRSGQKSKRQKVNEEPIVLPQGQMPSSPFIHSSGITQDYESIEMRSDDRRNQENNVDRWNNQNGNGFRL